MNSRRWGNISRGHKDEKTYWSANDDKDDVWKFINIPIYCNEFQPQWRTFSPPSRKLQPVRFLILLGLLRTVDVLDATYTRVLSSWCANNSPGRKGDEGSNFGKSGVWEFINIPLLS